MRLLNIWKRCFGSGFLECRGRADRAEFWIFSFLALPLAVLLVWLMLALEQLFPGLWDSPLPVGENVPRVLLRVLLLVIWLGLLIPAVCVTIRRLHDLNASGRWVVAALVPGLAAVCCWLPVSWGGMPPGLPATVLSVCAGGLAVIEGLAIMTFGLVFLGDGSHGPNQYGPDPLGRTPRYAPPADADGLPLATDDEDAEDIIDLDDVASPEWHDAPRVVLDRESEEQLHARELAQEAAPAVKDVVRFSGGRQDGADEPMPTEAFAEMVARALQKTNAVPPQAPAAVPPELRGKGDWPPPDLSPEEMSLAAQSLADLAARTDEPPAEPASAEPASAPEPPDEVLVDSLLEEMEQAEDARREAACIRPGQTVTQAMQRLEKRAQDGTDEGQAL